MSRGVPLLFLRYKIQYFWICKSGKIIQFRVRATIEGLPKKREYSKRNNNCPLEGKLMVLIINLAALKKQRKREKIIKPGWKFLSSQKRLTLDKNKIVEISSTYHPVNWSKKEVTGKWLFLSWQSNSPCYSRPDFKGKMSEVGRLDSEQFWKSRTWPRVVEGGKNKVWGQCEWKIC